MLPLIPGFDNREKACVLLLGSHCDDIEIGCGASVLTMVQSLPDISVHWVVFASNKQRVGEAEASAREFLDGAGEKTVHIMEFRDGFLPYHGGEVKEKFEELKTRVKPDLIFTHYRQDLHQDHRLVNELTLNTFRDHLILEYEIVKYDGDIGNPNVYIPVTRQCMERKIELLMKHYASQKSKSWFTEDTFSSMMRIRGVESNAGSGYAEAFYLRKAPLHFS